MKHLGVTGLKIFSIACLRFGARIRYPSWLMMLTLLVLTTAIGTAQAPTKPTGPVPEPAIPAILAAFDKYEVVAMPQDHGMQDLDDLIFSLIRNPAFSEKVNDIVFESGNSLYQPILDRYIAGEDVPFTDVQKVWRKWASRRLELRPSLSNSIRWCER